MGLTPAPGDLVAVDLPPGTAQLRMLTDLWQRGVAVLPMDGRLPQRERGRILELAEPAGIVGENGSFTVFATADSVDRRVGAVVATSGTGGRPKLVELSRAAVHAAIGGSASMLDSEAGEHWISCLPAAHVGGLLVILRASLGTARVDIHERFEPHRLIECAPAWASVVPTMVSRLVATNVRLDGLSLLVGGGALDGALRAAAERRGAVVVTTYGLTETCGGIAYDGALFPDTRARSGAEGEIELHGPTLMEGYRHDPHATAAAFAIDGWLRTGDLGHIDRDGRLRIQGRADDLIRTGGEKVWPEEVERVLLDHPKVGDVAVIGRPDPEWGQHVAAWIVPRSPAEVPTIDEIRDHCRDRLARFKAPKELVIVGTIPRTGSGKIRRGVLAVGRAETDEPAERRPESGRG